MPPWSMPDALNPKSGTTGVAVRFEGGLSVDTGGPMLAGVKKGSKKIC